MGHVQLTEDFAEEFGEVIIVIDVREELAIGSSHLVPLHAVHTGVVEAFGFLLADVVEHVGAFGCQVHLHLGLIAHGGKFFAGGGHFLDAASAQQEDVSFLVHLHAGPA